MPEDIPALLLQAWRAAQNLAPVSRREVQTPIELALVAVGVLHPPANPEVNP